MALSAALLTDTGAGTSTAGSSNLISAAALPLIFCGRITCLPAAPGTIGTAGAIGGLSTAAPALA